MVDEGKQEFMSDSNGLDLIKSIRNMLDENIRSIPNEVYEYLDGLTPDDIGKEVFEGGWVLRFEGFSDVCISDVLHRLELPDTDPKHLEHFDDVYAEVVREWTADEGTEPVEWDLTGDDEYPIIYGIFYKGN